MKLFYTKRSPYASKVRAVALNHGFELELIEIADLTKKPANLIEANPLGKVPTLILDDGTTLFDSVVICQYLDEIGKGKKLIGNNINERYEILKLDSIIDGIIDACIGLGLEEMHPENERIEAILNRHLSAMDRSFTFLDENIKTILGDLNIAAIGLACVLTYINLKLSDTVKWQDKYSNLKNWYEEILSNELIANIKPVNP